MIVQNPGIPEERMEKMMEHIAVFKKQLKDSGTKGLVIDLDETLSWTIHYMAGELAKRYGNPQNLSAEELRERMIADIPPFQVIKACLRGMPPVSVHVISLILFP